VTSTGETTQAAYKTCCTCGRKLSEATISHWKHTRFIAECRCGNVLYCVARDGEYYRSSE
jgi:hypothetical protein